MHSSHMHNCNFLCGCSHMLLTTHPLANVEDYSCIALHAIPTWCTCDTHMGYILYSHYVNVIFTWCTCDTHIMYIWYLHGVHVLLTLCTRHVHMVCMWYPHGVHVIPTWCTCLTHIMYMSYSHVAHVIHTWDTCDTHMLTCMTKITHWKAYMYPFKMHKCKFSDTCL